MEDGQGPVESIVVNLIQVGAPKAGDQLSAVKCSREPLHLLLQIFIGIILLIKWSGNLPTPKPLYNFLDLFAGKAQASISWCRA